MNEFYFFPLAKLTIFASALICWACPAMAQIPVSSYTTYTTPATPANRTSNGAFPNAETPFQIYFVNGAAPEKVYNQKFGQVHVTGPSSAAANESFISSLVAGGNTYKRVSFSATRPYTKVNIQRVNNTAFTGDYFSGQFAYSALKIAGTNTELPILDGFQNVRDNNTDVYMAASGDLTMALLLNSFSLSQGVDNLFSNVGHGNAGTSGAVYSTGNNIERVDLIYGSGLGATTTAALSKLGFLINDRGGNDNFKAAAITALDASGNVSALGNVITVSNTTSTWGTNSGLPLINTVVYMGVEGGTGVNLIRPKQLVNDQQVRGTFITYASLGVAVNARVYGIALFPSDFDPTTMNKLTLTGVLTNTDATTNGGLDMMAGSILTREENTFDILAQTLSGKVWNDANGNGLSGAGENNVSGNNTSSGGSIPAASNLYINVVDALTGRVVDNIPVNADGTYTYNKMLPDFAYSLVLNTVAGTVGSPATPATPAGWTNTRENLNGVVDSLTPGVISFTSPSNSNLVNYNFGIERLPVADAKTFIVPKSAFTSAPPDGFPVVSNYVSIKTNSTALTGYTTGGSLSGADPEDCATASSCNTGKTFNIVTVNANTRLYYDFGTGNGGIKQITAGTIINYDPAKLMIYGQTGSGSGASPIGFTYTLTDAAGKVSPAVPYSITTSTPLPLTLLQFTAQKTNNTVLLNWETTNEVNIRSIALMRSADGQTYERLADNIDAWAYTGSLRKYQFEDKAPLSGLGYYQLMITENNGTSQYSNTAVVLLNDAAVKPVSVWPNPFFDVINVQLSHPQTEKLQIRMLDIFGKVVYNTTAVAEINVPVTLTINRLKDLPPGFYYLVVDQASVKTMVQLIK